MTSVYVPLTEQAAASGAWFLEVFQHYHLIELRDRGLPEYAKTAIKMLPALEAGRKLA